MAARRRSHKTRDLPPNLYVRNDGYYSFRDPRTGKEYGLGRDKRYAINEAVAANMTLLPAAEINLAERINGTQTISVSEWSEQFRKIIESRNLKPKTLLEYDKYLKAIKLHMGKMAVRQLETRDVAAFLNKWVKEGKTTMANRVRSLMVDLFREAIAEGIITNNPAEASELRYNGNV